MYGIVYDFFIVLSASGNSQRHFEGCKGLSHSVMKLAPYFVFLLLLRYGKQSGLLAQKPVFFVYLCFAMLNSCVR